MFVITTGETMVRLLEEHTEQYERLRQFANLLTQISPFGYYYYVESSGTRTNIYVRNDFEEHFPVISEEIWERVVDGEEHLINISVDFFNESKDRVEIVETDYKTNWIIKKQPHQRVTKRDIYNYAIKVLGLKEGKFGIYEGETLIQIRVEEDRDGR